MSALLLGPSCDLCVTMTSAHIPAASLTYVPLDIPVSTYRGHGTGVERAVLKWHVHLALTSPNRCKVRAKIGLRQAQPCPTGPWSGKQRTGWMANEIINQHGGRHVSCRSLKLLLESWCGSVQTARKGEVGVSTVSR